MQDTTELERTSLEAHVDLCALRYGSLDKRLVTLEAKLTDIDEKLDQISLDFFKILVGTCGTIVVAIIGAVAMVYTKIL